MLGYEIGITYVRNDKEQGMITEGKLTVIGPIDSVEKILFAAKDLIEKENKKK